MGTMETMDIIEAMGRMDPTVTQAVMKTQLRLATTTGI
jgi:hypothetical protein